MALENVMKMVTDHAFRFKAEAEGAWNTYGSELAGDIANCGICNRPYEEHAYTNAATLREELIDIRRGQAETPAVQVDENGHLVLTEQEVERVARRVIEILGKELSTWSTLLQSSFRKA